MHYGDDEGNRNYGILAIYFNNNIKNVAFCEHTIEMYQLYLFICFLWFEINDKLTEIWDAYNNRSFEKSSKHKFVVSKKSINFGGFPISTFSDLLDGNLT